MIGVAIAADGVKRDYHLRPQLAHKLHQLADDLRLRRGSQRIRMNVVRRAGHAEGAVGVWTWWTWTWWSSRPEGEERNLDLDLVEILLVWLA